MGKRRLVFAFSFVTGCGLFFATSTLPRLQNGIPTIPTPGSGYPSGYIGVREFGWPATMKTERFSATHPSGVSIETTYTPLEHVIGQYDISVVESMRSLLKGTTINLMFFAVAVFFATVASNAVLERKFTLRELLYLVTCLGIIMGLLAYTWSRPAPSLYSPLDATEQIGAPELPVGRNLKPTSLAATR